MKAIYSILAILFVSIFASAQVVTFQPTFVTANDTVTVIYDASLGNGELVGVSKVYAHTGVITNASATNTDWRPIK
jgi:hypothetical protein